MITIVNTMLYSISIVTTRKCICNIIYIINQSIAYIIYTYIHGNKGYNSKR